MNFTDAIKKGFELVKLNREAYREIAGNPEAFTPAILIAAVAGLANWLSPPFNLLGFILYPIFEVIALAFVTAVIHFVVILLGGRSDYMTLFRVLGIAWIIRWAQVIPALGWVVGMVWGLVMSVVAVEELVGFDRMKSIVTVILPFAAVIVLGLIFSVIFGVAMLGFMGFSGMW